MAPPPRHAVIVGGNRIPFARSNDLYARASNWDMLTATLDGLVARFGLQGERLGEVVAGAVLKHPRDFNLTRECVLGSALAPETPAYDIQQACDTGLQAAIAVANKIALGQIESGIAGGTDTTSDAPIAVNGLVPLLGGWAWTSGSRRASTISSSAPTSSPMRWRALFGDPTGLSLPL